MKFTLSWLKEHLEFKSSIEELTEAMIKAGIEIESLEDYPEKLKAFSLAYVKHAEKHPNADKLNVCTVETKDGDLQIVCGAHNARPGIYVIYAPVDTYIPGLDVTLKKAAIRGVESNGMMLSEKEIGVSEEHGAIIELSKEDLGEHTAIGTSAATCLNMDDVIFDISITPNRGDLLGVRGIAKDLAAMGFGTLKPLDTKALTPSKENSNLTLDVNQDVSKKFIIRKIINVKNLPSPIWLQRKLKMIGQSPISALVDIANYTMFSLNQPFHCYDYNKVTSGSNDHISIQLHPYDKLEALDGKEYSSAGEMPTIAINNVISCIAGVMGTNNSACDENTSDILLEAAHFDSRLIALSKRHMGVNSESSYRFEREIDTAIMNEAIDYATNLILEICSGEFVEEVIYDTTKTKEPLKITPTYINQLSGLQLSAQEISTILINMGSKVEITEDALFVRPPSNRADIDNKSVIVAEIIRNHGLNNLPTFDLNTLPRNSHKVYDETFERILHTKKSLAQLGMLETINMSFISKDLAHDFEIFEENLCLSNPISEELSIMRKSIIPSLILNAIKNINHSYKNLSLFEVGKIYNIDNEENTASGILCGNSHTKDWHSEGRPYDVWDAKKTLYALIEDLNFNADNINISQTNIPSFYHSGKGAVLSLGKNIIGTFGELNPTLLDKLNIKANIHAFELFLDRIPYAKNKSIIKPQIKISDFMPITRDFSFVFNKEVTAGEIIRLVKSVDRKTITNVSIFDLYEGANIEPTKKSISFSVTLQAYEKTFVDSEIHDISNRIMEILEKKLQGELRK